MKKLLFLILLICIKQINAQIITTIAGSGNGGVWSGDGGQATAANFFDPSCVTFDTQGNLYTADAGNKCIRKINTLGVITTVVGSPTVGYYYVGDGGQATDAGLRYPTGVAFDISGNMFIADRDRNAIRKVNTAGIITTIAGNSNIQGFSGDGGLATAANLSYPCSIAFDATGNLYFSDYGNNAIRMVNTAGIINTVAGDTANGFGGDGGPATAAQLNYPFGVAFDHIGNLYISDLYNHRIRKVNTSGIITTICGDGTAAYSGDGGLATAAQLNFPYAISFDAMGNLFIADAFNSAIRKIDTSGIITTAVGNGTNYCDGNGGLATNAGLKYPWGVALNSTGNLFIADQSCQRIRKVSLPLTVTVNSASICASATTTLTASGGNTYSWSPSIGLSDSTGSVVIANPSITTTYTVVATKGDSMSLAISTVTVLALPSVSYTLTADTTPHTWDVYPAYSTNVNSATWYWGDGSSTIGFYPSHTYAVAGRYNICVSVYSVCGDSAQSCQNDSVYRYSYNSTSSNMIYVNVKNSTTGITNYNTKNSTIKIYPNPASNKITIDANDVVDVKLFDVVGKQISSAKQNQIDVSNLTEGVYFMQVKTTSTTITQKIIVQH